MLLTINNNDSRPIYLQITGQIKEQVSDGSLAPGTELPSVRELAESLGINMHTVRSAYLKLRDDGVIRLRLGRRAVISRKRPPQSNIDLETGIEARLQEVVTDALLAGMAEENLRQLLTKQLNRLK